MKKLLKHFWLFGLSSALLVAVSLSIGFTVWNWLENPNGIFHDATGTHWDFVYATASSWFADAFLIVFVTTSTAHLAAGKCISLYRNRKLR